MSGRIRAPIVIGVIGKRHLNGREEWVRSAMQRLFERLDADFVFSPKILLSGLAEGTDTIAAEEALKRGNWEVIAVLPLPLDLYREDFSEAGAARREAILGNPRVKTLTLPTLLDARDTGRALDLAELHRHSEASNPKRTDHYEQVGLFIADRAALLIAVMPGDEAPGRVGGTARIVHYRLNGQFDDVSKDILARSQELRAPNLLDDPHSGSVWLIDLAAAAADRAVPTRVLFPAQGTGGPFGVDKPVDASLKLVDRLDRFNRRILDIPEKRWQRDVVERAGADSGDATAMLKFLRLAMSSIQVQANRDRKWAIVLLAATFSVAAAAVELREGFYGLSKYWWGLYLACGLFTVAIYGLAGKKLWQRITEDYRAVAEALRVQIAWWESGLSGPDHRIERSFLTGTAGALALVRAAARHCIATALLMRRWPAQVPGADTDWIDGQIRYFETRILDRRKLLLTVEIVTWILFLGALGSAIYVTAFAAFQPVREAIAAAWRSWWTYAQPGALFLATLVSLAILSWGAFRLQTGGNLRETDPRRPTLERRWLALSIFMGIAFSASLYDLVQFLIVRGVPVDIMSDSESKVRAKEMCDELGAKLGEPSILLPQALAAAFAVVPAAIAGAVRYVVEKLSYEAELPTYEQALRTFRRARAELAAIAAAPVERETKGASREALLLALGREALEENEAWIRAHRERAIEPVV